MKVAIMYSGGKDSTYAIDLAMEKGWDIQYLLSVKPTTTECYLFHYATVEHTPKIAEILGLRHILLSCDVVDPAKEAEIVKQEVEKQQKIDPVDAVILGGTGLQETQLRSIQTALRPLGIEVFAAHAGLEHIEVMQDMVNKGYKFMITQVASDGLLPWLGKIITTDNLALLHKDAKKYGFHPGFEGGYADTFVLSAPIFGNKCIELQKCEKIIEDQYCGHIFAQKAIIKEMPLLVSDNAACQSSQ